MKKAAVIGYPVKHSLSPLLHGYWIGDYNIDGEYGLLEVKPEDLQEQLETLQERGYVGCNLTIPHKEDALGIVDQVSDRANLIGAVNTILVKDNGDLLGDNTDATGFTNNIKDKAPNFDFTKGKAVVLGAGGASRAVIASLLWEKVPQIIITNRTKQRAQELLAHFDQFDSENTLKIADWQDRDNILQDANLLVNTTSLGMEGQPELDISLQILPETALVTDIVYKPLQTYLLKKASQRGNIVVDGLGMLLYQAVPGFEMWFGRKPEVTEELRQYILKKINK